MPGLVAHQCSRRSWRSRLGRLPHFSSVTLLQTTQYAVQAIRKPRFY